MTSGNVAGSTAVSAETVPVCGSFQCPYRIRETTSTSANAAVCAVGGGNQAAEHLATGAFHDQVGRDDLAVGVTHRGLDGGTHHGDEHHQGQAEGQGGDGGSVRLGARAAD